MWLSGVWLLEQTKHYLNIYILLNLKLEMHGTCERTVKWLMIWCMEWRNEQEVEGRTQYKLLHYSVLPEKLSLKERKTGKLNHVLVYIISISTAQGHNSDT